MAFASSSLAEKKKVMFVMGATYIGKTILFIYLGTHFLYEIINSNKIQIYKDLDLTPT
ncbi:isopentenyltransferase [Medicago truncatula]|uniref:Isopentenyltransferase n=1 Tax=Medicago truncatula TaxID=3880 RepID=G7ZY22_MEDTR|nr:isopentenyltransferase [Medicago truncatula]